MAHNYILEIAPLCLLPIRYIQYTMNQIKHFLILTIICFCPGFMYSQINIEKLENLLTSYNLVDSSGTVFSLVQKTFVSPDSSDLYRIIYNSNGIITNPPVYLYAIRHDELDSLGRVLLSTSYLSNGEISPSIIYQYVYFDSTPMIQINHLTNKGQLSSRLEKEFDQNGRLIEKRSYDKKLKLEWRNTFEFDDNRYLRFEKMYDSRSNLVLDDCGVVFKVQKFPTSGYEENYLYILEESFYDIDMNLVDCTKHYGNGIVEPFSRVQRIREGSNVRELRYNAMNEIVFDEIIATEN